jgi:hypothetical protein
MRCSALVSVLISAATSAHAESTDSKLEHYETELRSLAANLPPLASASAKRHTLVEAEAMYAVGDYDGAARALFDTYEQLQGADKQAAAFYLGESLAQQGDRGSAREYLKAAAAGGNAGRYYVLAQQGIVALAIADRDFGEATAALQALEAVAAGQPIVPYLHGKLAFAEQKYDDALGFFAQVPKGSEYELEAAYFGGAASVTKKDLTKATDIFTDLTTRALRSPNDRRVAELANLALGRLYYERDEPTKSIDAYLAIDRHSDLFPEALSEVAWAYIRGKQFDKALRALELLEQSDASSARTPTVRILEGNLRIRKAQLLRQRQIDGTFNGEEKSSPTLEYEKADKLFAETHDQYAPSFIALKHVVDSHADPKALVDEVGGLSTHMFQLVPPLPPVAGQMLHDDPGVAEFIGVEDDLAAIRANIVSTEAAMQQLQANIASPDHSRLYPAIAARRSRLAQMATDVIAMRSGLADQQNDASAETQGRRSLVQQYVAFGDPESVYSQRVKAAHEALDKLADAADAVAADINGAQAIAVAMRTYAQHAKPALTPDQVDQISKAIEAAAPDANQIEDELASLRRELTLMQQLAGVGDAQIVQSRALMRQCKAAEDAELAVLAGHGRSTPAMQRAARIADTIAQLDQTLDASVEGGVAQARDVLAAESKTLEDFTAERARLEDQAKSQGGDALATSLQGVVDKLYDIVIRTDVGSVDVAWSEKEDTDDDLKRLNVVRGRELKQLRDEFKDILDQTTEKPSAPKKSFMPAPTEGVQQSPDMGKGGGDRIKPVDDPTNTTQPTVKPVDVPNGQNKGRTP